MEDHVQKRIMICQPMRGKTDYEIQIERDRVKKELEAEGYFVVNTLFTSEFVNPRMMELRGVLQVPLALLGKSLSNMALCHAVYFCKGWEKARGCKIEHEAAKAYGLDIIYEEE